MTNEGIALDMGWVMNSRVNKSAVDRRAAEIGTRRSVKKKWQVAWELRAIQCIDLTTLSGDDTPGNVLRLCAKARNPLKFEILEKIGIESLKTGAVCVYPNHVKEAGLSFPLLPSLFSLLSVSMRFVPILTPFCFLSSQGARRKRHPGCQRRHRLPRRPNTS